MRFHTKDCTAIITGASSGLGVEFARQLAPEARALILVARRLEALEAVKTDLISAHPNLRVEVVAADLATDAGRADLLAWVAGSPLGKDLNLLINNAGLGDYGTVASATAERLRAQIEVNITAVVLLSHALLPHLRRDPEAPAGILNVSSLASMAPMPDLAVYAASKAFVTSFSEALNIELAAEHIVVSYVCPGPTPTNFSQTAKRPDGSDTDREGQGLLRVPVAQVVGSALDGLRAGSSCVFPGAGVSVAGPLFRIMPRFLMRLILRRRFERRTL
ncbi:MAG: SDR family NAD(P)-dependent oxidoreductase [Prosthecobacter sp.]|nr:SDR family NAD(P)-dependent oxidoreductase [Prosthecobacter sp.]